MLKVLKFRHVNSYVGEFDEILVEDDSIPTMMCQCDLCFYKDCTTSNCAFIHQCGATIGHLNTYWLIGGCTRYTDGEANPNGRHVDVKSHSTPPRKKT